MSTSRRDFLRISGALTVAGLASDSLFVSVFNNEAEFKKIKKIGLQLYTLRDVMPKDPKGVLKQVAGFGYKQIESYEGPQGMFWGMSHTNFKKYIDDLGMTIISSHCDMNKDFEKKAEQAAAIGMKYLICPYLGEQKKMDDYKKFAETFNQKGEICRKNGIRFAYHNHEYSFKELEGQLPQDVMMSIADPALVDFEMDMYWVVTGGHDINAWLKKYKGRFKLCHVKDRTKGATERDASCTLGQGSIDYPSILKTARKNGVEYFIVEQEKYEGTTSLKAAEADAAYLKKVSI
jgi:sugar phosphate isomerase/epimerase